jgi:DNA-directed RNA polymerase subunit E'/Rpb7
MAATNEQIPVEDIQNTDAYVEYKMKELVEFITETLSKKDKYEGKDELFKQNLQHSLFDIMKPYERHIRRVADVYEESSNNNTYLRDVARLDETVRKSIEQKIDQQLKNDYVPPSPEVIEQRQREWLKGSENRARAYYRTPEGRKYRADEQERKQTQYQNRKDPLISKMRQGEEITEELKELNARIAELDPSVRNVINKAERRMREICDDQLREVSNEFDLKRAETKRLFAERTRQYPSNEEDYEKRLRRIDENEEDKKRPIRRRTEDAIVYMKTDYLRTGQLPNISEPTVQLETVEESPEDVPEPVKPELDYDNLYVKSIIHHKISVPFVNIGKNMEYYFKKHAVRYIEGKCRKEGFIRPNSIKVISYSTGLLQADNVVYDVVFSADVCYPCEDMIIKCKIINITKIGIRAIISEVYNPIVLFISREHNASKNFEDYEEGNVINIKVIGHRFELNDEYISVIGEII